MDFDRTHNEIPGVAIALHGCLTDKRLVLHRVHAVAWRYKERWENRTGCTISCIVFYIFIYFLYSTVPNVYLLLTPCWLSVFHWESRQGLAVHKCLADPVVWQVSNLMAHKDQPTNGKGKCWAHPPSQAAGCFLKLSYCYQWPVHC